MKKYLSALLFLSVILVFSSPLYAFASEKNDKTKCGSISITVKSPDEKEPIEGVKFNFYRVGDVFKSGDKFYYSLANGYKDSAVSLTVDEENEFKKETAIALTNYVNSNNITGVTVKTNDDGTAFVGNCRTGLYLIVPDEMPESIAYGQIDPFLVTLPVISTDSNKLEYSVKASPKVPPTFNDNIDVTDEDSTTANHNSIDGSDKTNTNHNGTSGEDNTTAPKKPSQLPNTGVLKWPVPLMATAGPLIFAIGYLDVIGRKKNNEK